MLALKSAKSVSANHSIKIMLIQLIQEASSTAHRYWNKKQHEKFRGKNSWKAINGKMGYTLCRIVNNLGLTTSKNVIISAQWTECDVSY